MPVTISPLNLSERDMNTNMKFLKFKLLFCNPVMYFLLIKHIYLKSKANQVCISILYFEYAIYINKHLYKQTYTNLLLETI